MGSVANVNCVLKVNAKCHGCKKKMMEVLSAIKGVYSVDIDAEKGIVNIFGEVDPNLLLQALARSGTHAELVRVKLQHPALKNRSSYNYDNDYGTSGYGSYGHVRAINDSNQYVTSYANYNYDPLAGPLPPARYVPSAPPALEYKNANDDEPLGCTII